MTRSQAILLKHFSTGLMVLSVLFVLFVLAPFPPWWPQPKLSDKNQASWFIDIPKIHASAPIIVNVDPWDKNSYQNELKQGVAHASGSSLPGEPGTSYLFAHSSDWPWNITRYNTAFFKIYQLEVGDTIIIYKNSQPIDFTVTEKKVIRPWESEGLFDQSVNRLILQTCTPIGTDWNRLLLIARPT